jgi:hypothetical protein
MIMCADVVSGATGCTLVQLQEPYDHVLLLLVQLGVHPRL